MLCYQPDFPDRLEGLCNRNKQIRERSVNFMFLKTAQMYPITREFVHKCASGSTGIFKVHIMQALWENGFTDKIFGELYKKLFDSSVEGNINHVPQYEDIFDVVRQIHEAGGIAVLAHPQRCKNPGLLDKLVEEAGLDGIEVYAPTTSEEDKVTLLKYAKKHKLLTTGGTNFKGLYNRHVISVGDCEIPDECVQELLTYKARKRKSERKAAKAAASSEQ